MKKIFITVILCFLFIFVGNVKSKNVSLYGFTPASVDSLPPFKVKKIIRHYNEVVFAGILANIDKKGKVKSLKAVNKKDSLIVPVVELYIKQLSFKPAILNNKKIKSILPIDVVIHKRVN